MAETANETDVTITYDTLFEILRNEKTSGDLQVLQPNFYTDVVQYLKEKEEALQQEGMFDDSAKLQQQTANTRRILTEIFERREKKIISMAMNAARYHDSIIDTKALLPDEKLFYDILVGTLRSQRDKVLHSVLKGVVPVVSQVSQPKPAEQTPTNLMVRFTAVVPAFMAEDMKEYGPFEEEDVATLPASVARVLIDKGRAEIIEQ